MKKSVSTRLPILLLILALLPSCAMIRAKDAEIAQAAMIGMSKESAFACMGIPDRQAKQGNTEIWLYKSTNGYKEKNTTTSSLSGASSVNDSFLDALSSSLALETETSSKRFCLVQIILKNDHVQKINYSGPTGGLLTEDEQCAFAVRNCLPAQ